MNKNTVGSATTNAASRGLHDELRPRWRRSFRLSSDPFFVGKVRDIAGLYLNPPDKAVVLVRR